ncbi:MAG TPA: hypothetical protein VKE74_29270 [Gemmataceae bacterium]|nr:hypothetical protein [Gemmataceae bacterium]
MTNTTDALPLTAEPEPFAPAPTPPVGSAWSLGEFKEILPPPSFIGNRESAPVTWSIEVLAVLTRDARAVLLAAQQRGEQAAKLAVTMARLNAENDPRVIAAVKKCDRLSESIVRARSERADLHRAAERLAAVVREKLSAGENPVASESDRDAAERLATRLGVRIGELTELLAGSEQDLASAKAEAVRDALLALRAEHWQRYQDAIRPAVEAVLAALPAVYEDGALVTLIGNNIQ